MHNFSHQNSRKLCDTSQRNCCLPVLLHPLERRCVSSLASGNFAGSRGFFETSEILWNSLDTRSQRILLPGLDLTTISVCRGCVTIAISCYRSDILRMTPRLIGSAAPLNNTTVIDHCGHTSNSKTTRRVSTMKQSIQAASIVSVETVIAVFWCRIIPTVSYKHGSLIILQSSTTMVTPPTVKQQ